MEHREPPCPPHPGEPDHRKQNSHMPASPFRNTRSWITPCDRDTILKSRVVTAHKRQVGDRTTNNLHGLQRLPRETNAAFRLQRAKLRKSTDNDYPSQGATKHRGDREKAARLIRTCRGTGPRQGERRLLRHYFTGLLRRLQQRRQPVTGPNPGIRGCSRLLFAVNPTPSG